MKEFWLGGEQGLHDFADVSAHGEMPLIRVQVQPASSYSLGEQLRVLGRQTRTRSPAQSSRLASDQGSEYP